MFRKAKGGKLRLSVETVRSLQATELEDAAGGVKKLTALSECSFTDPDTVRCQPFPCPFSWNC